MQIYVLGFLFSPDFKKVVLIQKKRPQWQAGRWNGVGGKIEAGETHVGAMEREFFEETGLRITHWKMFAQLCFEGGRVWMHYATSALIQDVHTMTDEDVEVFAAIDILCNDAISTVGNVPWLIQMAKALGKQRDMAENFMITEGAA